MKVVIPQQERHLLGKRLLEGDNILECYEGITPVNPVNLIRVQIVAQENDSRLLVHILHRSTPKFSAVKVRNDEYLVGYVHIIIQLPCFVR